MIKRFKVYDLKEYIERNSIEGKEYTVFDFPTGIGIIEGNNGVIAIDSEGIGHKLNNLEEKFKVGINDKSRLNEIYMMAHYVININSKEIIENCNYKEMLLTEFIDRYNYNDRLRKNFGTLLKAINDIGLNSSDYYKKGVCIK